MLLYMQASKLVPAVRFCDSPQNEPPSFSAERKTRKTINITITSVFLVLLHAAMWPK